MDSKTNFYYEPPLVSTSPSDLPPASVETDGSATPSEQASAPRESRTPLADQIKDEHKLHVNVRTYSTDYPQAATGTT